MVEDSGSEGRAELLEGRNRILEAKLDACHQVFHKIGMALLGRWHKAEPAGVLVDQTLEALFNEQAQCEYDSLQPPQRQPMIRVKAGEGRTSRPSEFGGIPLAGTGNP